MLASAGPLLARGALLPAGLLETTRMRDANIAEPSRAVVRSVEFHPDGQVLMTAGLDKRLRFFQVCPSPDRPLCPLSTSLKSTKPCCITWTCRSQPPLVNE